MNCKLTDFADTSDLLAFIKKSETLMSPSEIQQCLAVGDNGVGASGKTTATDTVAMCALPNSDIVARWGSTASGWGKKVNVTYGGKTITVELEDISPPGVCDLNPAALKLLGEKHPFSGTGSWEWADAVVTPAPVPAPVPAPKPKTTPHFAIVSRSTALTSFEVMKIAEACNEQAADVLKHWGRDYAVLGYDKESDVPLGYYKSINEDDVGDPSALGFHTDELGQPVAYCKVQDLDSTCITNSHEIPETRIDPSGNHFIVINLAPYGEVRCLVEVCDPCEAFSYKTSNGLPVSDVITPEWYDEVKKPGVKYTFGDNLPEPQTIGKGGYFSFMLANGTWMQKTWWSGDAPVDEGPFNWQTQDGESLREMVDRETRNRRPV